MKTIKAEEIPRDQDARQFLQSLDVSSGEILFEQDGKPRLIFVSADIFRQRQEAKQKFFALVERIQRDHPDLDSEAVLSELEELDS
jgi:hypothetical protein